MSAIGTIADIRVAPQMSAFGGKADVACGVPSARLFLR